LISAYFAYSAVLYHFVATFVADFVEIPIRNRDDKGRDEVFRSAGFWHRL